MKHRLAVWLRRSADRLDPPPNPQPWVTTATNCTAGTGTIRYVVKP